MSWILVWWVINPWHSQAIHMETDFKTELSCAQYAEQISANDSKPIRWHCSRQ